MRTLIISAVLAALLCSDVGADEIELVHGQKMSGVLVKLTTDAIHFKVRISGTLAYTRMPRTRVRSVTVNGIRKIITPAKTQPRKKSSAPPRVKSSIKRRSANKPAAGRTKSEIEKLVADAGKSRPTWWSQSKLNYPSTLDLTFPKKPGGAWNNRKNLGQYYWDIINPNSTKWKEGIKLGHYVRALASKRGDTDCARRVEAMLADKYFNLLQDWPRALHFFRRSANPWQRYRIAACYWRLGNRQMAIDTLRQYAGNNTKAEVKLWADLGEFKTAASLCSRISPHDIRSYLMGEIFRLQGDYQKALSYFQQTIAVKKSSSSRRYDQYVKRARSAAAAIKLFELLDLRRVPNGVYRDKSTGYAGDVQIEATIRGGRIIGLKVTRHREKQYYASLTDTPARIIKKQSLKGISATTGATLTSEAIINATAKALAGGQR